ncbi:glycosyltransferase family 4 protein [Paenibacillus pedocola]|uniref:glycosyltransferase family 4 protein n=1 Tax=Paenibacillus pedocola TaxID=3242193 RepID=UPI0028778D33|nr:glycosyltransferase family 4 protein [Paenibacillus typhae]
MRIVFIRSNPVNPDPRVEKEVETLIEGGYDVTIIGWDRSLNSNNEGILHLGGKKIYINRIGVKAGFGNGLKTLIPLFIFQIKLLFWLLKNRKTIDTIHACDFDTVLPSLIMKYAFKKKLVYDIFDFYTDAFSVPRFLKSIIRFIDLKVITLSDAVIIVNEARKEQIKGSQPHNLEIIHNSPKKISTIQNNYQSYKFKIVYIGILQNGRYLLEIIDFVKKNEGWEFVIAGFGRLEQEILEKIKNSNNISFIGKVSYEEGLNLSKDASVLFAIYDPSIPNHKFSSPNKLYEAMMLGKPIIVAKNTGIDILVEDNEIGLSVNYGDEEGIRKAFEYLANNENIAKAMGIKANLLYEKKYSWDIMGIKLLELYKKLV